MIDLNLLRNNPEIVRAAIANKGVDVDLDLVVELDKQHVALIQEAEKLREARNKFSSTIKGKPDEHEILKARELRNSLSELEEKLAKKRVEFQAQFKKIPNIPSSDTPIGLSESDNVVVHTWGDRRSFDFEVKNHYELALHHDWIDKERASSVAGSRFAYIKGDLVRLQFAIISFVFDRLTDKDFIENTVNEANLNVSNKPFVPILPPYMIRTDMYDAMDRLEPSSERYKIEGQDLWLQGSAEHVLGSMHANQTFDIGELPIRYIGYATSFRREAGAAGKDMEGIIRLHQFDKLEMESFSDPNSAHDEHLLFAEIQEKLMQLLEIPYQKIQKCTFDIGKPNAKGSDIEAWLPGQAKYRETHTADYMSDYQARRLNTRVRGSDGALSFAHTNDATAFACGRIMIAILENYQNRDLSVRIPEVLRGYMNGRSQIG